jgi:hypothetical protein
VSALQRPVGSWDRPGAAGLLELGEVVPDGLPLELVRAVVAPRDGMTCRLGELTTALTVRLLDLMPVSRSRTRPGVSRSTDVPSSVDPPVGRAGRRHHDIVSSRTVPGPATIPARVAGLLPRPAREGDYIDGATRRPWWRPCGTTAAWVGGC